MLSAAEIDVLVKVVLAGILGFVVGWEREFMARREAGTRTFSLVAMSATLVTALSFQLFSQDAASRVLANLMVGVGFLGGGMIMKDSPGHIRVLTSAAGVWAMAAVGMAVGSDRIGLGVVGALLVLLVFSFDRVEDAMRRLLRRPRPVDQPGGDWPPT